MKKIILLLFSTILLCGCSNKLVCTYKETYEDVKINNKIIFDFKNNKYIQIDTMKFKSKELAEDYYKDIESYKEEYNLVLNDNTISSKIETELKLNGSRNDIKTQYESYDYKCR